MGKVAEWSVEIGLLDIFYYQIFKKYNLFLRNRIIWHFGHGLHASKRFSGRYETILWFTKSKDYIFNLDAVRVPAKYPGKRHYKGKNKGKLSGNPKGKNPSDLWEIAIDEWAKEVWEIPNVKSNHPEKTMVGKMLYSPSSLNKAFKAKFDQKDWLRKRVSCDYQDYDYYTAGYAPPISASKPYREIDFLKNKVGVEVQFGKYAFMVYNVCAKMTIFHNLEFIDVGIENKKAELSILIQLGIINNNYLS